MENGNRVDHAIVGKSGNEDPMLDLTGFMRNNNMIGYVNRDDTHLYAALTSAYVIDEAMPPSGDPPHEKKYQLAYLNRARGIDGTGQMPMIAFSGNTLPGGIARHMPGMLGGTSGIFWPKLEDKRDPQTLQHEDAQSELRAAGVDPMVFERYVINRRDDFPHIRYAHLVAAAVNYVMRNRHLMHITMWIQGVPERMLQGLYENIRKGVDTAFNQSPPNVIDGDHVIRDKIGWPANPEEDTPWWTEPEEVHRDFYEAVGVELHKASQSAVILVNTSLIAVKAYLDAGGVVIGYVEMDEQVHRRRIATRDPANMQPTVAVPLDPGVVTLVKEAGATRFTDIYVPKGITSGMILAPSGSGKSHFVAEMKLSFDAPIIDRNLAPGLENLLGANAREILMACARADHTRGIDFIGKWSNVGISYGPAHAFPSPPLLIPKGGRSVPNKQDRDDAVLTALDLSAQIEVGMLLYADMKKKSSIHAEQLYLMNTPYLDMVPTTDIVSIPRAFYYLAVVDVPRYDPNARLYVMISYKRAKRILESRTPADGLAGGFRNPDVLGHGKLLSHTIYECLWVFPTFNTRPSGIGGLTAIKNRDAFAPGRSIPFIRDILSSSAQPSGHAMAALPLSPGPFINYLIEILYNFHQPLSGPFPFPTIEPSTGGAFHSTTEYQAAIDVISPYVARDGTNFEIRAIRVLRSNIVLLERIMKLLRV
uniref:Uncharacterized protein n=1 Tax=viral metagenome TaxID=1070528 RepID=A0A2V0RIW7_9ZZZZ